MTSNRTRTLVSVLLATTCLVAAHGAALSTAAAQPQSTGAHPDEKLYTFNISAKPVPQALNEIGRVTGLSIVLTEQNALSATARSVVGAFTARQALASALAGTGVTYRFTNARTVTIKPAGAADSGAPLTTGSVGGADDSSGVVALDTIEIQGNGGSGGVVGYLATRTSTATKTNTPLIDIPQSISVVTKELIRDQAMQSIADTVRYTPGVNVAQGEGNRDQLVIRGQATTADFYVDGMRDDVQYYRDLYNVDRVEALKGPNAMIFGRGGGGGVINRVMKAAEFTPIHEILLQGGSFGDKRVQFDMGQPLTGDVAVRLNGMYEESGSFRDFVDLRRYGINPTAAFRLGEKTTVKLGYEYFHDDRTADRGIPSYLGRPFPTNPSTFFGNPWASKAKADVQAATAEVKHETDSGVAIRNFSRFASYEKFYQNVFPGAVSPNGTQVAISAYNNATDRDNLFNQTDIIYTLDTGPIRHELLAGAEFGLQKTTNFRETGYFNDRSTSVSVSTLAPIPLNPITFRQSATDNNNRTTTTVAAGYIQDQITFSRFFQLIGGLRFDRYNVEFHNNRNGQNLSREDNLLSPRVGVVVKPVDNMSIYASYTVSYLPSSGDQFGSLTVTQAALKPEKFTNYEVGAKWNILPNLMLTAAIYQLDRTNTTATDPNNPAVVVLTGSQRTNGVEIGLNGYVTDAWQVAGAYAYQDARITSTTTAAPAGAIVPLVPRNTFSLWNKYQFNDMWGAGVGLIHQTKIYAAIDDTVTLPGFTRVDAAVFFKFNDNIRAQLNIENLFNTGYYATAHSNNNISPGSPRAAKFVLTGTF